jgi:hypothetical protein
VRVAAQQQGIYTQLINKLDEQTEGQVVGDLWIGGAQASAIPYGGVGCRAYAGWVASGKLILSKNVVSPDA